MLSTQLVWEKEDRCV